MGEIIKSKKIKYNYIEYDDTKIIEEQQIDVVKLVDGIEQSTFEIITRELSADEVEKYNSGNLKERSEEFDYQVEEMDKQEDFEKPIEEIKQEEKNVPPSTESYQEKFNNNVKENIPPKKKKKSSFKFIIIIAIIAIFTVSYTQYKSRENIVEDEREQFIKENYDNNFVPTIETSSNPIAHEGVYKLLKFPVDSYAIVCNDSCVYSVEGTESHSYQDNTSFKYLELSREDDIWDNDSTIILEGDLDIYKKKDIKVTSKDDRFTQGNYEVGKDIDPGAYLVVDDACSAQVDGNDDYYRGKYIIVDKNSGFVTLKGNEWFGLGQCQMLPIDKLVMPKDEKHTYFIGQVGTDIKPGLYRSFEEYGYFTSADLTIYSPDGSYDYSFSPYVYLKDGDYVIVDSGFLKPVWTI